MKKSEDVERLYQNYIRYQSGDKSALDEVFMEVGKKVGETKRIVELEEEYKLSHTENVLDAGLVQDEIQYRRNDRKLKVAFSFPCLKDMVRRAKYDYSKKGIFTGYENGKKIDSHGYKKFHSGKYDTLELEEVMQEIVIKLFQGKLSGSNIDIIDGITLLRNIKYYLTIEIGNYNKVLCKNVPETYIDRKNGEEMSYFDQYSKKIWLESKGQISRILPYSDCLEWLQRNDVHYLFNRDSSNIYAIIDAILKFEGVFEKGEDGDLKLVKQKILKNIIYNLEGIYIAEQNISIGLKRMEQNLIDFLLQSLNYYIGKAPGSNGNYDKESERCLYKQSKQAFIKIFSKGKQQLYKACLGYTEGFLSLNDFMCTLQIHENTVLPILLKEKGRWKYDMVNLLMGNDDVMNEDYNTVLWNIADLLVRSFQEEENKRVERLLEQHQAECFNKKCKYWEAKLQDKCLQLRLWTGEDRKKPIRYDINRDDLIVYEGCVKYYFIDCESCICYLMPINDRVISKADKKHKIFLYKIV